MKVLTFGCSYSQVPVVTDKPDDWTWPLFLDKSLTGMPIETENHQGLGASGNDVISRRTIYYVTEALKTSKPEDLLVGIMWSGCDRHSLVLRESKRHYERLNILPDFLAEDAPTYEDFVNKWFESECTNKGELTLREHWLLMKQYYNNPHRIASKEFNHITLNNHWTDHLTTTYYENFVDPLSSVLKTVENILRTQWFLKQHNIKYFMCAYDVDTFIYFGVPRQNKPLYSDDCPALSLGAQDDWHSLPYNYLEHPEIKYLYEMIDKDHWLPVDSLGEWCNHVSEFDFPSSTDPHPGWEQHQDFVNKVILPFLLKKYNISRYNI